MVLNPILDSVDELPEPIREHYRPTDDGKFVLDVKPENGWSLENVSGLKSTLGKMKDEAAKARAKLEAFADIDPDLAREAIAKYEEVQNWTPDEKVQEKIRSHERQLLAKHEKEVAKAKERSESLYKALDDRLRRAAIVEACSELKGNPHILVPLALDRIRTVEEDGKYVARVIGDDGSARISMKQGSTEPMSVREFVGELREDKRYMAAFEGLEASGSGGSSANGRGGGSNTAGLEGQQLIAAARRAGGTTGRHGR